MRGRSNDQSSALDARTTRHGGYTASQRVRKRIESIFGWGKTIAGLRKTRYRGVSPNDHVACMQAAAYNLLRVSTLACSPA